MHQHSGKRIFKKTFIKIWQQRKNIFTFASQKTKNMQRAILNMDLAKWYSPFIGYSGWGKH
jgi:hypothetical protein